MGTAIQSGHVHHWYTARIDVFAGLSMLLVLAKSVAVHLQDALLHRKAVHMPPAFKAGVSIGGDSKALAYISGAS